MIQSRAAVRMCRQVCSCVSLLLKKKNRKVGKIKTNRENRYYPGGAMAGVRAQVCRDFAAAHLLSVPDLPYVVA